MSTRDDLLADAHPRPSILSTEYQCPAERCGRLYVPLLVGVSDEVQRDNIARFVADHVRTAHGWVPRDYADESYQRGRTDAARAVRRYASYVGGVYDVVSPRIRMAADIAEGITPEPAPTLPPSSRQRGSFPAKAAHDRRLSSADEADLRDDGGTR